MHKLIAVNTSHGFQGRYFEKHDEAHASEHELREMARARGIEAHALIPPPHFRFADEALNKKAAEALADHAARKSGKPGKAGNGAETEPEPEMEKPEPEKSGKAGKSGKPGKAGNGAETGDGD